MPPGRPFFPYSPTTQGTPPGAHPKKPDMQIFRICILRTQTTKTPRHTLDSEVCKLYLWFSQPSTQQAEMGKQPKAASSPCASWKNWMFSFIMKGFPGGSDSKESACNAGDLGSIPGSGRSPGGGHGHPLHYSCLENPHGQRSLVGYSPWGLKESPNMTKHSITYNKMIVGVFPGGPVSKTPCFQCRGPEFNL